MKCDACMAADLLTSTLAKNGIQVLSQPRHKSAPPSSLERGTDFAALLDRASPSQPEKRGDADRQTALKEKESFARSEQTGRQDDAQNVREDRSRPDISQADRAQSRSQRDDNARHDPARTSGEQEQTSLQHAASSKEAHQASAPDKAPSDNSSNAPAFETADTDTQTSSATAQQLSDKGADGSAEQSNIDINVETSLSPEDQARLAVLASLTLSGQTPVPSAVVPSAPQGPAPAQNQAQALAAQAGLPTALAAQAMQAGTLSGKPSDQVITGGEGAATAAAGKTAGQAIAATAQALPQGLNKELNDMQGKLAAQLMTSSGPTPTFTDPSTASARSGLVLTATGGEAGQAGTPSQGAPSLATALAQSGTAQPATSFDTLAKAFPQGDLAKAQGTNALGTASDTHDMPADLIRINLQGQTAGQAALQGKPGAGHAQPAHAVPLAAPLIAGEISKQALQGKTRFEIRLDPPELGRIHVQLDIAQDGSARTHLVVERAETLAMLQRDARSLEQALNQSGVKSEQGQLTFSLKDQSGQSFGGQAFGQQNFNDSSSHHSTHPQESALSLMEGPSELDELSADTLHLAQYMRFQARSTLDVKV
jgi:flagellar hook-length control protein FliK